MTAKNSSTDAISFQDIVVLFDQVRRNIRALSSIENEDFVPNEKLRGHITEEIIAQINVLKHLREFYFEEFDERNRKEKYSYSVKTPVIPGKLITLNTLTPESKPTEE